MNVQRGQYWKRVSDGEYLEVQYTIGHEARVRYFTTGRWAYAHLSSFGRKYVPLTKRELAAVARSVAPEFRRGAVRGRRDA